MMQKLCKDVAFPSCGQRGHNETCWRGTERRADPARGSLLTPQLCCPFLPPPLQLNLLCSQCCFCTEETSMVQIKRTRCSEVANSHVGFFCLFVFLAHESKFRLVGGGGIGGVRGTAQKSISGLRAERNISAACK